MTPDETPSQPVASGKIIAMTPAHLSLAKDSALCGSLAAMRRAVEMARERAVRINTAIVGFRNGKVVCISADELQSAGFR